MRRRYGSQWLGIEMRIALGGFQHEANTFAPSKPRFEDGEGLMATLRDGFGCA